MSPQVPGNSYTLIFNVLLLLLFVCFRIYANFICAHKSNNLLIYPNFIIYISIKVPRWWTQSHYLYQILAIKNYTYIFYLRMGQFPLYFKCENWAILISETLIGFRSINHYLLFEIQAPGFIKLIVYRMLNHFWSTLRIHKAICGTGDMAQWVKVLALKTGGCEFDNQGKSQAWPQMPVTPALVGRDWQTQRASWLASLAYMSCFWFISRSSLKKTRHRGTQKVT